MRVLRTIVSWGWAPILITALAVVGCIYQWSVWLIAPAVISILIIGLVVAVRGEREKEF